MKQNNIILFKNIKMIFKKWGFTKEGLRRNSKGESYLFSQLLLILLHLLPSYPKNEYIQYPIKLIFTILGIVISILGLIIAIKALKDLGDNLTPLPYPMKDSNLIKINSYKNTRHPLYKGIILISLGIFMLNLSLLHLFLLISLAYVLRMKALKEEENLKIKFPEYAQYIKKVPAIIKNIKYLDWRS